MPTALADACGIPADEKTFRPKLDLDKVATESMDIEVGNAGAVDTNGTGWFIGFSDWTKSTTDRSLASLRYMPKNSLAHTLHMKWMEHPADDDRGQQKPPSAGRTISILVSQAGRFRIQFSNSETFADQQIVETCLSKHGDFVIWGEDIYHRWFVDEQCTVLTLRWIPIEPDEVSKLGQA
jgi:hypothetical protein